LSLMDLNAAVTRYSAVQVPIGDPQPVD